MPFYEYKCNKCGHFMEVMQKMSDAPLTQCPQCGQPGLKKLISAAAFHLKGGGWYATDFKDRKGGKDKTDKSAESKPAEQKKPAADCGSGACPACSD